MSDPKIYIAVGSVAYVAAGFYLRSKLVTSATVAGSAQCDPKTAPSGLSLGLVMTWPYQLATNATARSAFMGGDVNCVDARSLLRGNPIMSGPYATRTGTR